MKKLILFLFFTTTWLCSSDVPSEDERPRTPQNILRDRWDGVRTPEPRGERRLPNIGEERRQARDRHREEEALARGMNNLGLEGNNR